MVRYQMAHAAVRQHGVSVASGVEFGKVRFNLLNGFITQKLLFAHDLERLLGINLIHLGRISLVLLSNLC